MSSALNQLIAQSRGPDILGAIGQATQTAGALQQLNSIPVQQQLEQQKLTMGQKQLAMLDQQAKQQQQEKSLQFSANLGLQISKEKDPGRKAQLFASGRQMAQQMGLDTSQWPQEYNEQTQQGLDNIVAHVYGPEQFKTDEAIRQQQSKPAGPASGVGKLIADRKAAEAGGASPQELKAYDDAIVKARTVTNSDVPSAIREYEYREKLSPEGKAEWDKNKRGDRVSTEVEKNIFKASDEAQAESVKHENYMELARQYEQSAGKMSSGVVGSFSEWIKEQTGNQDQVSLLRKDWAAVKASEVVKNLPPGAASDADVALALAGFLPTNAKPEMVASFLRGIAKLSKINGEYQSFKANYLAENKSPSGMLKAWRDYSKDAVPTGSTLSSSNTQQTAPAFKDGQTATNPQTGEKMIFKDGQWQKM